MTVAIVGYKVKITRVAQQIGIYYHSHIGHVSYSRVFENKAEAEREANAWSATGEFAHYAPSNFTGEVEPAFHIEGRPGCSNERCPVASTLLDLEAGLCGYCQWRAAEDAEREARMSQV